MLVSKTSRRGFESFSVRKMSYGVMVAQQVLVLFV